MLFPAPLPTVFRAVAYATRRLTDSPDGFYALRSRLFPFLPSPWQALFSFRQQEKFQFQNRHEDGFEEPALVLGYPTVT